MMQTINISLIPSDNKPVINVSQYDNGLRVLRFNIFDDIEMEVPHEFDGETVTCNIRKNDNNIVVITGTIETETTEETEESYVQVVLTEQACACVGSNYGEISLSSGDDVIGTCNFKLIVERSPLAGGITSQTDIDNLTTQIEEIAEQVIGDDYYNKEEINGMFHDLDIPTKTSELTNDSGFITAEDVPTKTSELTNDSGFTTIDDAATVSDKTWSSEKISDELYAILPVGTASGTVASFNTALAKPLVSCVVDSNATKLVKTTGNSSYAPFFRGLFLGTHDFVDLGSLTWTYNSNNKIFYNNLIPMKLNTLLLCTKYEQSFVVAGAPQPDKTIWNRAYSYTPKNIIIKDTTYSDANTFTTAMNGVYLIYELETPITPTITTNQFATLCTAFGINGDFINLPFAEMPITYVGDNNFFTDYGDTTVQYKDTVNNYIDTRINTVSNRSLSAMRDILAFTGTTRDLDAMDIQRGETDDQK